MPSVSLQQQFDYLFRSLSSACTEFQAHYDIVSVGGVNATEQKEFGAKVNALLPVVRTSSAIIEMTEWWRSAKPSAPAYDVLPDLFGLETDMEAFQMVVFKGTPKENDTGYIKDTTMLLDGIEEKDLIEPYNGPHIISYAPRQYTASQASAEYLPALQTILNTLNTILDS